ncbi:phosphoenolpyruvate synthase, partial [Candidatus Micrarchaeota archaeon]|nr:phosphoenolpyruvate synthase [Candidatus Micrarchaeota archaeon]
MNFVFAFKKLNKKSVGIAGGKGAQLGEMFNAGIPVPNGFVILADSFNYFMKENNLEKTIKEELKKVNSKNTDSVNKASEKIRKEIFKGIIPKEIEESIWKEFNVLKANYVAVRSSATAE